MSPVQRALQKITFVQTRRPVWILSFALGLAALSILYTVRNLGFQTSQMDLISPKERLLKLSRQIAAFDVLDTFIIVIENRNDARSLEFLQTLVRLLKSDRRHYLQVFSRVDPESFKPWALLYLDREDLLNLQNNLREHGSFIENLARSPDLVHFFKAVDHEMTSAMVGKLFTGFLDETKREPLDLAFLIRTLEAMKKWLEGGVAFASPWESLLRGEPWSKSSEEGYFWTKDKRYLLAFITPRKIDEGFADTLSSLRALRSTIAGLKPDFPDIEAGVTGMEALNEDEMGIAFKDMSIATLISFFSLALLLMIFWRGFRRPLMEMIELSVALSCTFGLTTLLIGHLNILSVTFAPLLLGLGIDYGIHWFARFQEEEQSRGSAKEEAIQNTMLKIGPGVVLAGLTAALSFFPLVLTGFKGLVELGMITSMGMVMATLTTLCLLPSLALLFDRSGRRGFASMGESRNLLRFDRRKAFIVLVAGGVAVLLSLRGAAGIAFDLNMLKLQSKKAESVLWERKLLEGSERSSMYGAVLADSLEEVRKKAKALQGLPTVSEVQSVVSLLPQDQEEKIRMLREMAPLVAGFGPLSVPQQSVDLVELDGLLGKIRFKMLEGSRSEWGQSKPLEDQMARVRELIDSLRQRFAAVEHSSAIGRLKDFEKALITDLDDKLGILRMNVNANPMGISDLPEPLRRRFVDEQDRYLIRVFPSVDVWNPDLLGRFVQDLRSVDPDARGDPVTLHVFTKEFREAAIEAGVYAVLFILAALFLTFRNLASVLLVVTPLVAGTIWTLGLMSLFGVDFNLANAIFFPLVVGAGIEYGVIIMQRRREERDSGEDEVILPRSTGKGVILAGLTTTVGFGSLTVSSHQGIYSLGLLATVGSLSMLAAAVVFLPALLRVLPQRE